MVAASVWLATAGRFEKFSPKVVTRLASAVKFVIDSDPAVPHHAEALAEAPAEDALPVDDPASMA